MINKDKVKGFISGIIFTMVLSISVIGVTALASPAKSTIPVVYDDIKIYVDGTLIELKDSSGNVIKPFISNGVTYLPVAAVSRALGKDVSWDGKTKSIYIGKKPDKIEEVTVSNVEELFAAFGSNKHIKLKPGIYNLSDLKQDYNTENIHWEEVFDGKELILDKISNLTIEGLGDKPVELIAEPRYANVLTFLNCNKIAIKNVKAGHTIEKGYCTGGVFNFISSKNIDISNSILYGCGTYGIIALYTENLQFTDSIIEECTYGAMTIDNCKNFKFSNSIIRKCEEYSLFDIISSSNIIFDKCEVTDNKGSEVLLVNSSSGIKFTNCVFKNNDFTNNISYPDIDFTGTDFE